MEASMLFEIDMLCVIAIVIGIVVVCLVSGILNLIITNVLMDKIVKMFDRTMDAFKEDF